MTTITEHFEKIRQLEKDKKKHEKDSKKYEKALRLCRDFIKNNEIQHVIIFDKRNPDMSLGEYIDKVLK